MASSNTVQTVFYCLRPSTWRYPCLAGAAELGWDYGVRLLPGFGMVLLLSGIALGGWAFPALEPYQTILPKGAPFVYTLLIFVLIPFLSALWVGLFAAPALALRSIQIEHHGLHKALILCGVPRAMLHRVPSLFGCLCAMLILSGFGIALFCFASVAAWTAQRDSGRGLILEWLRDAVVLQPLLSLPLKLAAFALILSTVPDHVAQRFPSMNALTARGGFFSITVRILALLTVTESLWLLLFIL